jgi:Ca2+-binding RTX toxin-like protein
MFTLIVGGTQGNDQITISRDGTGLRVGIVGPASNFVQTLQGPVDRIEVYTQGGNDNVVIAPEVTVPAFVFAGNGNDTLQGGSAPTVLVGGSGRDSLRSGTGDSILIGGAGNNLLVGASGSDLLIGGRTLFDANLDALKALLTEWTRTDAIYSQKVSDLTGVTVGENGAYLLNASTVFDDGSADQLIGAPGGLNLYFARLDGPKKDQIEALNPGEIVIDIF